MGAFFETEEARYHVWFDPATMKCDRVLYKNPTRGRQGEFPVRKLNIEAACNVPIIAALMKEVVDRKLVDEMVRRRTAEQTAATRAEAVKLSVLRFWRAQMLGQPIERPADMDDETFANLSRQLAEQFFPAVEI